MHRTNIGIILELVRELKRIKASKEYFSSPSDFTRDRVFTLETVFQILLDLPKLSLSVEIEQQLADINHLLDKQESGTKSGFCKARNKIKPELFKDMNSNMVEQYYQRAKLKRWKGFILRAIDGSSIDVLDTVENRLEFGEHGNQHGSVAQGRMMLGYDVLNKIITHANLGKLSVGEVTVAKQWIEQMQSDELNIYDRLFPGMTLQYLHDYHETFYVMRCKLGHNNFVKEFIKSGKKEQTQDWVLNRSALGQLRKMGMPVNNKTSIRVRMLRVELANGEIEVLLTNLLDNKKYSHKLFKELYFKRWGVEVENGFLKNTLQIEITSGKRPKTIYQDFYATILRANIQALIEQDCEVQIQQINCRRKHNYTINRTAAAGNLKRMLAQLLWGENPQQSYDRIMVVFIKNLEPVRLNRKYPRIKKSQKLCGKYKPFNNYKRAI